MAWRFVATTHAAGAAAEWVGSMTVKATAMTCRLRLSNGTEITNAQRTNIKLLTAWAKFCDVLKESGDVR